MMLDWAQELTSSLLCLECKIILIQFLLLLFASLEGLGLTA